MNESTIGKKIVRDVDVDGRRILLRADLNAPLEDGAVADDTRLVASLPTIRYVLERRARVIVCSHLGRPKGAPDPKYSLGPVAIRLGELLGMEVAFAPDCIGAEARAAAERLAPGDVLLLENLRFHPGEEANDPAFARELASLADIYVDDAFGAAHRAHASTAGVAEHLPAVAGLLMEREVRYLKTIVESPPRPFALIVGGAKVSTKISAVEHLLPSLDMLLIGGGMANTFLRTLGHDTGRSLLEPGLVPAAARILERAATLGVQVELPVDVVVAPELDVDAAASVVEVDSVPGNAMILDIGPRTIDAYREALDGAQAIVWNGPMGVFEIEQFARGSFALAEAIAASGATTVVGGGETAAVVARAGVADRITHVSTGGGASLELLEGRELPGIAALDDA